MRSGKLNKAELRRIGRIYTDLSALIAALPPAGERNREEAELGDRLTRAAHECAVVLRWQDFGGVWQEVSKPNPEAPTP